MQYVSTTFFSYVTQGLNGKKLTHEHLYRVARRLTSKSDIRRLGLKLGIADHRIDAIFHNKRDDITEAAYEILKEWRKSQEDAKVAFITLIKALTHPDVNLHQVAQEGLKFNWMVDMGKLCSMQNFTPVQYSLLPSSLILLKHHTSP